jgi:hypothetical protein
MLCLQIATTRDIDLPVWGKQWKAPDFIVVVWFQVCESVKICVRASKSEDYWG